jgi:dephospho-CoA kinase
MQVGLTGGVASGKSTVAAMLAELGALVIDSDVLAREVVEPGTPGLVAVVAAFGDGVLADDGTLDRRSLGAVVFADDEKRARLEAILHPLIRQRGQALAEEAGAERLVVHDIPLLVESGQAGRFDGVIVVDVPVEVQVDRMVRDRGWTRDEALARIRAQATREQRLAAATEVIDNTGTLEDLRERVAEVVERLDSTGPTGD